MPITCCKDCTERVAGCHSTCSKYIEQKKAWDETRSKMLLERNTGMDFDKYYKRLYTRKKVGNGWRGRGQ